jgi:hypothetical protein
LANVCSSKSSHQPSKSEGGSIDKQGAEDRGEPKPEHQNTTEVKSNIADGPPASTEGDKEEASDDSDSSEDDFPPPPG